MARFEPEESKIFTVCTECGGEIYCGELYGVRDGKRLCLDCAEDKWRGLRPQERMETLGFSPARDGLILWEV